MDNSIKKNLNLGLINQNKNALKTGLLFRMRIIRFEFYSIISFNAKNSLQVSCFNDTKQ